MANQTEIQGIFQGDVVVRSAIISAMQAVRKDPALLNHIFHSLAEDDVTRDVYGEKQIQLAKDWFMKTDIPVMMNFRIAEEHLPAIAISLQESAEADQTHADVHYVPQERTPGDWPVLTRPFTPVAYSPVSGIMVLPEGLMGDKVIGAGMFVMTRDGRHHVVRQNLGDDEISLTPYTADDFTGAVIKGSTERYVTTVESVTFKEVYQIGIHVISEPAYLLYLHSIVQFMLLKYKQDLLERRGYERTSLASTDFRRNLEFENEEVFSRYITITGYARHVWPKDTTQTIDVVDSQLEVAHIPEPRPRFAISPFQTLDAPAPLPEPDAVNDEGEEPGEDDSWSVIPLASPPPPPPVASPSTPDPEPEEPELPELGMVFWVKGDADMNSTGSDLTSWLDQAGQSQDLDTVSAIAPQTGLDSIDGVPAVTFPAGDLSVAAWRGQSLKDRNGDPMPHTQSRTIMAVIRPTRHESVTRIGGPVFATADDPNFECLFQIENWWIFNDAWFIFDNIWSFSGYQKLAPVTSVATWEDVPALAEWRSSGFPEIAFAANGVDQALQTTSGVPTTVQEGVISGPAGTTFVVGNCWNTSGNLIEANFHGSIAEVVVWDYDLSTDPVAHAAAHAYFAARYPSLGI